MVADGDDPRGRGACYVGHVDPDGTESPDVAVARVLAAVEGVPVTNLDYRLGDYVDPDAIDTLLSGYDDAAGERWSLSFAVEEHVVTVESDGAITVTAKGNC